MMCGDSLAKPPAPDRERPARLSLRIFIGADGRLGPGKIDLLEAIDAHGSIRKAAAALDMSYRRAWLLVQATEDIFSRPVLATAVGGTDGGGARLTEAGRRIVAAYRAVERKAAKAAAGELAVLDALTSKAGR